MTRFVFGVLAAAACGAALAGEVAAPPSTSGVLLQGLFGLVLVLLTLGGFFWVLRRFVPGQQTAQGVVKVVGGVMLGPRERLVVVEVDDTWLLLGVGGGQITRLHDLPRPPDYQAPAAPMMPAMPAFAEKLRERLRPSGKP